MIYVFLSFLCLQGSAFADAQEAEQNRIRSEIKQYRKTSDWEGMNKAYEKLEDLHTRKNPLKFSDYVLGAYVSQELGYLDECVERLQNALKINPQASEEQAWLSLIVDSTAPVNLRVSTKERTLLIDEMPFDPVFQKAIDVADMAFQTDGRFEGLLPFGVYTYGDQTFTVAKDKKARWKKVVLPEIPSEEQEVVANPKEETKSKKPKKPKKKRTPGEKYGFAPFSLDIMVHGIRYVASDIDRTNNGSNLPSADYSIFNFSNAGLGLGFVSRVSLKKWTSLDIPVAVRGNFEFLSSTDARLFGFSGGVFALKRFGNLELGLGYFGSLSKISWSCATIKEGIIGTAEETMCVEDSKNSDFGDYFGSGVGGSVLFDLTQYIGLEITPACTWDGDFSIYCRGAAHLQISFR